MVSNQVVWIDVERCTGCGACVKACPVGAITLTDGKAHVDEKTCTGCGACLSVCPEEAIKPIVEGELVQAEKPESRLPDRSPSRAPAVQRSRPLVEAAAPALAVAGAGLLAKLTRAMARAVGNWLTHSLERTGAVNNRSSQAPQQPGVGRSNGRGRRTRHRRRGR